MGTVDNYKRRVIPLTTSAGVLLDYDTDMASMQTLTATGAETLDFYLSWDGRLNIELVNIRVACDTSVVISYNLYYYALGAWKSIAPYATSLTGAQALAGISTSYPLVEDIVSGTKIKFSVVTAGACTVGVSANGRL